jgi:hypothetical protein
MTRFLYISYLFKEVLIEETPSYTDVFMSLWHYIRKIDFRIGPEPTQVIPEIQKTWGVLKEVDLVTNEDYIVASLIQVETATRYDHPALKDWMSLRPNQGMETWVPQCWERKMEMRGWVPEPAQQMITRFAIHQCGGFSRNPYKKQMSDESDLQRPKEYCRGVLRASEWEMDWHWTGHRKNAKTLRPAYRERMGLAGRRH